MGISSSKYDQAIEDAWAHRCRQKAGSPEEASALAEWERMRARLFDFRSKHREAEKSRAIAQANDEIAQAKRTLQGHHRNEISRVAAERDLKRAFMQWYKACGDQQSANYKENHDEYVRLDEVHRDLVAKSWQQQRRDDEKNKLQSNIDHRWSYVQTQKHQSPSWYRWLASWERAKADLSSFNGDTKAMRKSLAIADANDKTSKAKEIFDNTLPDTLQRFRAEAIWRRHQALWCDACEDPSGSAHWRAEAIKLDKKGYALEKMRGHRRR
jgi:hypothetical protein